MANYSLITNQSTNFNYWGAGSGTNSDYPSGYQYAINQVNEVNQLPFMSSSFQLQPEPIIPASMPAAYYFMPPPPSSSPNAYGNQYAVMPIDQAPIGNVQVPWENFVLPNIHEFAFKISRATYEYYNITFNDDL